MKTKQITDISLRTFENTTVADAWIALYGNPNGDNNEIVFKGLQYNNKEDGKRYEAAFTSVWGWDEVILDIGDIVIPESELGGANLFIVGAQGLGGALADPQWDPEIEAINPTAQIALSITVDDREDSVDPNIQITIETDGGKEYVTDYVILDATNEDTSTGGLPTLGTIAKTDMVFIDNDPLNDRRFRGVGSFASKPSGVEVTQIRLAGNGGQSILIPINRAQPVSAATDVTDFAVESPATPNHTYVRATQTYSLDFHFNLTTTVGNDNIAQSTATFPTQIELSGASVDGTYTYTLLGGQIPSFPSANTDYVVTVTGVPANLTLTSDTGDAAYVTINAESARSDAGTLLGTGSTSVQIDNNLPTISGGVVAYPIVDNSARFGAIQQKAFKTSDITGNRGTTVVTDVITNGDLGSNAVYQINTNTGFSTTTAGTPPISGSGTISIDFVIDGIPGAGVATVTDAFNIQVYKARTDYQVTQDVETRYQQNDLALTDAGIRVGRDPGFTRTYTFNYESLASVVENSDDVTVVADAALSTAIGGLTADLAVAINIFTTTRQVYNYEFYAVGESGEELLNSEVGATDNDIEAKGFTDINFSLDADNIVGPGEYNGITVPNNSYEIDLQNAALISTPAIPGGSTLTVVDPALLVAENGPAGLQTTYSLAGSQYVYIDNSVGTQIVTMRLEETVS